MDQKQSCQRTEIRLLKHGAAKTQSEEASGTHQYRAMHFHRKFKLRVNAHTRVFTGLPSRLETACAGYTVERSGDFNFNIDGARQASTDTTRGQQFFSTRPRFSVWKPIQQHWRNCRPTIGRRGPALFTKRSRSLGRAFQMRSRSSQLDWLRTRRFP